MIHMTVSEFVGFLIGAFSLGAWVMTSIAWYRTTRAANRLLDLLDILNEEAARRSERDRFNREGNGNDV